MRTDSFIVYNIKQNISTLEDYNKLVPDGLSERFLDECRHVISTAAFGGDTEWDQFCGNGGIDIAAMLYCEVLRLNKLLEEMKYELT